MKYITILERIIENLRIYLGLFDLRRLELFLSGYFVCALDNGITIEGANGFQRFVEDYYNCHDTIDWTEIALKNSPNGEAAFDVAKELVKTYKLNSN